MPKFTVYVHETLVHRLNIEAPSEHVARDFGETLIRFHGELDPWTSTIEANDAEPLPDDASVDYTEADFRNYPPEN